MYIYIECAPNISIFLFLTCFDWFFFAHSFLYSILLSYRFGPVCPQRLPNIANETAALEKMPKGRLEYLRRLLPYLQNQSEDCLYLNIYVPIQGKFTFIFLLFSALFLYALMWSLNVCDLHKIQTNKKTLKWRHNTFVDTWPTRIIRIKMRQSMLTAEFTEPIVIIVIGEMATKYETILFIFD